MLLCDWNNGHTRLFVCTNFKQKTRTHLNIVYKLWLPHIYLKLYIFYILYIVPYKYIYLYIIFTIHRYIYISCIFIISARARIIIPLTSTFDSARAVLCFLIIYLKMYNSFIGYFFYVKKIWLILKDTWCIKFLLAISD